MSNCEKITKTTLFVFNFIKQKITHDQNKTLKQLYLCQVTIRHCIAILNNDRFGISNLISFGLQFSSHNLVFMFSDTMVVYSFSEVFRFSLHPVQHSVKVNDLRCIVILS